MLWKDLCNAIYFKETTPLICICRGCHTCPAKNPGLLPVLHVHSMMLITALLSYHAKAHALEASTWNGDMPYASLRPWSASEESGTSLLLIIKSTMLRA